MRHIWGDMTYYRSPFDIFGGCVLSPAGFTPLCIGQFRGAYLVNHPLTKLQPEAKCEAHALLIRPIDAHCCHNGTAIKHSMSDRVKSSFLIFDIRSL